MGISLGNYLSGAASALTNAAGGNQAGQLQGTEMNQGNVLTALQLARQQAQDQLARQSAQSRMALEAAQGNEAGARAQALLNPPAKPKESYVVPGVGLGHYDETGKFVVDQAEPAKPQDHYSPVVTTGAGGVQQVTPFDTSKGTMGAPVAQAKATPTPGAGGNGAQTSVSDLIAKDKAMSALEPGLVASKSLTAMKEGEAAAGQGAAFQSAHGATSPYQAASVFVGQRLGQALGENDPTAQRYIELGTNFGDEASNAFKGRTNEASAARKIALSRIQAQNASNPGVLGDTQEKRRNIIGMAILSHPEQRASLDPATVAYYTKGLDPADVAASTAEASTAPQPPTGGNTYTYGGRTYRVP